MNVVVKDNNSKAGGDFRKVFDVISTGALVLVEDSLEVFAI